MNVSFTLPFGIDFSHSVTHQLDKEAVGKPFTFRICLDVGCIVMLSLDATMLKAMRGGKSLELSGVSVENVSVPFNISLNEFNETFVRGEAITTAPQSK